MPSNNVQKFREALMLSKAELARKSGLSTLTIDRVEAGRPCRLDTKRKILLALSLRITDKDQVFSPTSDARERGQRAARRRSTLERSGGRSTCGSRFPASDPSRSSVSTSARRRSRPSSCRAAAAARNSNSRTWVSPRCPREAIVQGAFLNSSAIVEAIREAIEKAKIRTKNVAAAVSGHSVIVKKVSLPAMTRDELDEQIRWEAEQYIPFDVNEVNLDFQILNGGGGEGQMEVLLVAAKKDLVDDYVQVIREAGLVPVGDRRRRLRGRERLRGELRRAARRGRGARQHRGAGRQHQHHLERRSRLHARHHHRRQPVHRGDPEGALDQLRGGRAHQARRAALGEQPGGGAAGGGVGDALGHRDGDRRDQPVARLLLGHQRRQPDRAGRALRRRRQRGRAAGGLPAAQRRRRSRSWTRWRA